MVEDCLSARLRLDMFVQIEFRQELAYDWVQRYFRGRKRFAEDKSSWHQVSWAFIREFQSDHCLQGRACELALGLWKLTAERDKSLMDFIDFEDQVRLYDPDADNSSATFQSLFSLVLTASNQKWLYDFLTGPHSLVDLGAAEQWLARAMSLEYAIRYRAKNMV